VAQVGILCRPYLTRLKAVRFTRSPSGRKVINLDIVVVVARPAGDFRHVVSSFLRIDGEFSLWVRLTFVFVNFQGCYFGFQITNDLSEETHGDRIGYLSLHFLVPSERVAKLSSNCSLIALVTAL
jgi:hypothetical protein